MKTPPLRLNRVLLYLRLTASSAFFAAAAALALVAASPNALTTGNVAATKRLPLRSSQLQDSVRAAASESFEKDGSFTETPSAAAEERAHRAYPGTSVDTLNAIISFKRFMAASASAATPTSPAKKGPLSRKSKKAPPEPPRFHTWSMVGPNNAPYPSILTFSGGPYVSSGRITALALDTASGCNAAFCRLWVGAAGGGVWRTTNALAASPTWTFLTGLNFWTNAIGTLTYDNAHGVLYAGTGEPNASGDSEAGLGVFRSTDGGDTWTQLPAQIGPVTTFSPTGEGMFSANGTYTGNAFLNYSVSSIVVDPTNPSVLYVSTALGFRDVDSTSGGPFFPFSLFLPPTPRPPHGLFKSTDGGQTFSLIWDGSTTCPGSCVGSDQSASILGVNEVELDRSNHNIVYAASFPGNNGTGGGVWRSSDGGTTWTQIKTAADSKNRLDRATFDVTTLGNGNTRMYVGVGNDGSTAAHVFRSDLVQTGAPAFIDLTDAEVPAGQSLNYCHTQCYYDNVVVASQEFPDFVVVAGNYSYSGPGGDSNPYGTNSDGKAVIASNTAGASWFDWTWDAQNNGMPPGQCCNPNQEPVVGPAPNLMHPDHHALVIVPGTGASIIFDGSDGGLVRTDGNFQNISGQCTGVRTADGTATNVPLCQQLLSRVPNQLIYMNRGLATLQFQSLSVAADNPFHLQGGTQDNGTFDNNGGSLTWNQTNLGDGGQNGFNVSNSSLRFSSTTEQEHFANFRNGDPSEWVLISGSIKSSAEFEKSLFYPPIIADPNSAAAGSIFEGSRHVWRTQDWGGSQAFLEAKCRGIYSSPICGDFVPLGGVAGINNSGDLSGTFYGDDRLGSGASVIARTTTNTNTAWAATAGGRVFISTNIDNPTASAVVWTRLDADSASSKDPTRFPSGIAIDPSNVFHAWISYSGYSSNTPSQAGHVFSVTWIGAGPATWTNISNNLPDIPITSVVFDPVTGDLYASSDFAVFRLAHGHTVWDIAGLGMPLVEVPNLTIVPSARLLYAGTHGLSAWSLPLY